MEKKATNILEEYLYPFQTIKKDEQTAKTAKLLIGWAALASLATVARATYTDTVRAANVKKRAKTYSKVKLTDLNMGVPTKEKEATIIEGAVSTLDNVSSDAVKYLANPNTAASKPFIDYMAMLLGVYGGVKGTGYLMDKALKRKGTADINALKQKYFDKIKTEVYEIDPDKSNEEAKSKEKTASSSPWSMTKTILASAFLALYAGSTAAGYSYARDNNEEVARYKAIKNIARKRATIDREPITLDLASLPDSVSEKKETTPTTSESIRTSSVII